MNSKQEKDLEKLLNDVDKAVAKYNKKAKSLVALSRVGYVVQDLDNYIHDLKTEIEDNEEEESFEDKYGVIDKDWEPEWELIEGSYSVNAPGGGDGWFPSSFC